LLPVNTEDSNRSCTREESTHSCIISCNEEENEVDMLLAARYEGVQGDSFFDVFVDLGIGNIARSIASRYPSPSFISGTMYYELIGAENCVGIICPEDEVEGCEFIL